MLRVVRIRIIGLFIIVRIVIPVIRIQVITSVLIMI